MTLSRFPLFVLIVGSLALPAAAQNPTVQSNVESSSSGLRSAPAPALSGMGGVGAFTEDSENLPRIPALLGGAGNSLAFPSEMQRSNYLRAGMNVGAAYDDNALLGSGEQVGNTTFSVFPNLALDQSTSRMRWSLGYGGGLTVNQRLSNRNQGSHNLNFDSEFRLSPHVNLRAVENFSATSGMFAASTSPNFQIAPAGANASLITPLANMRSSQTIVATNYHFARNDLVGATGSYYTLHYSDITTGAGSLADTQTASGSAFWLHKIVHSDWAGIGYRFERMTYGPTGETRVHGISVINTLSISRAFTLSAFIGPEYSDNYGVAATGPNARQFTRFTGWSTAGGVDLGWRKQRTSLTGGYSRRISNGSGVVGAVRLEDVHGSVRREFLPGWSAAAMATYGNNESLTLTSTLTSATTATSIKTTSIGASLDRNIGRSFGLQFAYFHDLQSQSGIAAQSTSYDANRNRFSVTLSYQWARALGR